MNKRQAVYEKTQGRCAYCGEVLNSFSFPIDHIHPKSRMGDNSISNSFASCKMCNTRKKNKTAEEFKLWIVNRIAHDIDHLQETLDWATNSEFWTEEEISESCYMFREFQKVILDVLHVEPYFYYERMNHER